MKIHINIMRYLIFIVFVSTVFSLASVQSCRPSASGTSSPESTPDSLMQEQLTEKGTEIAGLITSSLVSTLFTAIEEKGVAGAVEFCSLKAIPITDSISKAESVSIQRISHKPRNPDNSATMEERELINRLKARPGNNGPDMTPVIISQDGAHTFYSPVFIATPTCLQCHGMVDKDIQPEVLEVLRSGYPEDMATGFELGEMRGLLKIVF
jgi:hypothetical protein